MSEDSEPRRARSTAKGAAWSMPAVAIGDAAPASVPSADTEDLVDADGCTVPVPPVTPRVPLSTDSSGEEASS